MGEGGTLGLAAYSLENEKGKCTNKATCSVQTEHSNTYVLPCAGGAQDLTDKYKGNSFLQPRNHCSV